MSVLLGVIVGANLGKAKLTVFAEGGSEVTLKTAVLVEKGDFGTLLHEGGDGRAGESGVALNNDMVYFEQGDAHFALRLPGFFVFGNADDQGVALFFDK